MWKSQTFPFCAAETFWNAPRHSSNHHSKALVIRKKSDWHNMCWDGLHLLRETMKCSLGVFKKTFLEVNIGSKFTSFLRCLIFEKIHVFIISSKNIENNPHNVYIFGTAEARPFQNRFKHDHTMFVDGSTTSQLGPII